VQLLRGHARTRTKQAGETDERLFAPAAWQDTPYFSDAERAVLALTEAATRLSDRAEPVPDEIWDEVARHYDEATLAGIVLAIATINAWNRSTSRPSSRPTPALMSERVSWRARAPRSGAGDGG
jgi:alkylhydroperoxidase family enzyme